MNKVQILVIEDDIAVGNLITTTLEMENYQFVWQKQRSKES